MAKEHLIVFLKAPRPGTVKTRIAQTAGAERACGIYHELVETVLRKLNPLKEVELCFAPDDASSEIQRWLRSGWTARAQGEGDLGARLTRAFASAFANGAERVVIIGSDCPEVKTADIRTAWKELQTHDLVVGPAVDGGYWLIGLRTSRADLFRDINWSSDQVFAQTLAQARKQALRIQVLRILTDIDTEEDWNAYVSENRLPS